MKATREVLILLGYWSHKKKKKYWTIRFVQHGQLCLSMQWKRF